MISRSTVASVAMGAVGSRATPVADAPCWLLAWLALACTAGPDHRNNVDQLERNSGIVRREAERRRSRSLVRSLRRRIRYGRTASPMTFLECARNSTSTCCACQRALAGGEEYRENNRNHLHSLVAVESTEEESQSALRMPRSATTVRALKSQAHTERPVAGVLAILEEMVRQDMSNVAARRTSSEERPQTVAFSCIHKNMVDSPGRRRMRRPFGAGRGRHREDVVVIRSSVVVARHRGGNASWRGGGGSEADIKEEDVEERVNLL